jgi:hypothetical protein
VDDIQRKARYDFLIAMYKALWDNINRHITVLWQAAGVLATAFGAALLLKRDSASNSNDPTTDVAAAVVVAASCWLVAHAWDASIWINRNLQIIGNVEAHFLTRDETSYVHPYIGFRRANKPLMHTIIQAALGVVIGLAAYAMHFGARVAPTFSLHAHVDWVRALPTLALVGGVLFDLYVFCDGHGQFAKFQDGLLLDPVQPEKKPDSRWTRLVRWIFECIAHQKAPQTHNSNGTSADTSDSTSNENERELTE